MNVKAEPQSRQNICKVAWELRKLMGMDKELYFPIVPFIEILFSGLYTDCNYEIVPVSEMKDMYGTTNTSMNTMRIREDVYEGAIRGVPRDRFTLGHELGHFVLHQPSSISFARGRVPLYCQPEWQANTFAGELLAPRCLIGNMKPEEIAERCGLSLTAANIQYKQIHKL